MKNYMFIIPLVNMFVDVVGCHCGNETQEKKNVKLMILQLNWSYKPVCSDGQTHVDSKPMQLSRSARQDRIFKTFWLNLFKEHDM